MTTDMYHNMNYVYGVRGIHLKLFHFKYDNLDVK